MDPITHPDQQPATTARATRVHEAPEALSIEALDVEIVALSTQITAAEYQLLIRIREFDARGGWLKWGSTSCAHWLHWRCDLSLSAAREKVRVAHALHELPEISRHFEAGTLSYSKVRALTRVATPANEAELLAFALNVSAALVEQHCQQLRNVHPESVSIADCAYRHRGLSASRNPVRSTLTITVELPLEEGERVLNTLDQVLARQSDSADASTSYRARQADALLDLCREYEGSRVDLREHSRVDLREHSRGDLRGGAETGESPTTATSISSTDAYQVVIHADQSALSDAPESTARADLPVETIRRLCCDGTVLSISNDRKGLPIDVGRRKRTVSGHLKRALLARDRQCRFPGCSHTRFVDAHHIQHWAQGGETRLDNLLLLCGHHHRLIHEGGFSIFVDNNGNQCFRRPDGRAVPVCGYRDEDQQDNA